MQYKQTMAEPEERSNNLLIIGGLLVDDIAKSAENLSVGSSNPVKWHHKLGGVATNVARVAAQQLDVLLIANVGDDNHGKLLADLLAKHAMPSSLVVWQSHTSDRYTAVLNPDGELFIGLADASLAEQMCWPDIEARLPEWRPDAIVLDANLSASCLTDSVTTLASRYESRVPIYALSVSPAKATRWLSVAHHIDVLLCNRREAASLTQQDWQSDINLLADGLLGKQFSSFVITDGGNAILVQDRQSRTMITVPEIQIDRNVNGAGDAMAAATIAQLILGQQLPQAVSAAGLSAAQAVLAGTLESPSI